jgi:DNA polymerase III sliding clamp (beta) subunit (PCNA family)
MKDGVFIPRNVINEVLKFAETSKSYREALSGIWVNVDDKINPIIETTDGHRLHRITVDNTKITPFDTNKVVHDALDKKPSVIDFNSDEIANLIFKLKEIESISKLHYRKNDLFRNLKIKISNKRVIFIAEDKVLIRYIEPSTGIPEKLNGLTLGININYLIDAVGLFEGKEMQIMLHNEISPIIFKSQSDLPIHTLMPVKLYNGRQ